MGIISRITLNLGLALGLAAGEEQKNDDQLSPGQDRAKSAELTLNNVFPEGASPETKDRILLAVVKNIAKALGVNKDSHEIYANYDPSEDFFAKNANGKYPDGVIISEVTISKGLADKLSYTETKFVIGHEIIHGEQKRSAPPLEGKKAEIDADLRAAKLSGGQTAINALEKLGTVLPKNHTSTESHPSIRERQAEIIRAFPEESLEIISPIKSQISDRLEAQIVPKEPEQIAHYKTSLEHTKQSLGTVESRASDPFLLEKLATPSQPKENQKLGRNNGTGSIGR